MESAIEYIVDLGVSDVANGFPGWGPYLWIQFQHLVLGLLAGAAGLALAVPFFAAWTLKEVFFDSPANGGALVVAIDSVADLGFGLLGCCLISLARRRWLSDCLRSGVIPNRSDCPQNSPKQRLR